jgi:hypothetical protein
MKEVLAGLAADGEPARLIGPRPEPALHRFANGFVLVLIRSATAMLLRSSSSDALNSSEK